MTFGRSTLLLAIFWGGNGWKNNNNNNMAATALDPRSFQRIFRGATTRDQVLENARTHPETERAWKRERSLQGRDGTDSTPLLASHFGGTPGFYHSVASGDPLADAVIVWTRYTPVAVDDEITLELRMVALNDDDGDDINDSDMASDDTWWDGAFSTTVQVTAATDWVAKLDVTGLEANQPYAFVFTDGEQHHSDIGLTRTAPAPDADVDELTYAVFTCAIMTNGYFHSYDVASTMEHLDFWIHVGDFIYEYGKFYDYGRGAPSRDDSVLPDWEAITLQDYRLRYASYIHSDEGLRNLRRRAPMLANWDDHESVNDAFGNDKAYGGENHQPVCPVGPSASIEDKIEALCDRDEGDAYKRFQGAAQAYFEWLPLRYNGNNHTTVDFSAGNTVLEWGNLATFVRLDTRLSRRTKSGGLALEKPGLIGFTFSYPNADRYGKIGLSRFFLRRLAKREMRKRKDSRQAIIGDQIETLQTAFQNSKAAGKPWQVYVAGVVLGNFLIADPLDHYKVIPFSNILLRRRVKRFWKLRSRRPVAGAPIRVFAAASKGAISWNLDDWNGFHYERDTIYSIFQNDANTAIALSGDIHNAFAWRLHVGGSSSGAKVGVNLQPASVTSPGLYDYTLEILDSSIEGIVGGREALSRNLEDMFYMANPTLDFVDLDTSGFMAVKVTPEQHVAEYMSIAGKDRLRDYDAARAANPNGNLTSTVTCLASVTTTAYEPGSLERSDECGAVSYRVDARPSWLGGTVNLTVHPIVGAPDVADCGFQGCTVNFL